MLRYCQRSFAAVALGLWLFLTLLTAMVGGETKWMLSHSSQYRGGALTVFVGHGGSALVINFTPNASTTSKEFLVPPSAIFALESTCSYQLQIFNEAIARREA